MTIEIKGNGYSDQIPNGKSLIVHSGKREYEMISFSDGFTAHYFDDERKFISRRFQIGDGGMVIDGIWYRPAIVM